MSEKSSYGTEGMVVSPQCLSTQSALSVLRAGGSAVEAAVAAAAVLAVVYPHMNSIGGDGFWLILPPHGDPLAIEACGAAGTLATPDLYAAGGNIPYKGAKAAITVAGTVGGWQEALNFASECGYRKLSVSRLLADAVKYAEDGFPASVSLVEELIKMKENDTITEDIARFYLIDGEIPKVGQRLYQPELASTLKHLSKNGLNSFYSGELAKSLVADFVHLGIPITDADLYNYRAIRKKPIKFSHSKGEIYNLPPPTQGLVSLSILGILDQSDFDYKNDTEFIHTIVESTKQAFIMRDQFITDPKYMTVDYESLISPTALSKMAGKITHKASLDGRGKGSSDTVWLGVMDNKGFSVSFIQSIYHEFGSGVVLPSSGILWHNRGVAFSLNKNSILALEPGKKPFHTLNPAAAKLNDGRVMVYGTRGGDGQSQTQAAIFHRYVIQQIPLQKCIHLPRWCYGRTVGDKSDILRIEGRFSKEIIDSLRKRGHIIEVLPDFSEVVGHAGALVRHSDGIIEGAYDVRSDGTALGF